MKKIVLSLTVITSIITVMNVFLPRLFFNILLGKKEASSIGIIGGADGPTAIFLAGKTSFNFMAYIVAFIAIGGIIYLIMTRKEI